MLDVVHVGNGPSPHQGVPFFLYPTSLFRRAQQRRVLRRRLMLPTTPSDLDLLPPWTAQDARRDLMESRKRARQSCEEANAVCVTAAELREETVRLRHSAGQLRTVAAQLRAESRRRRHKRVGRVASSSCGTTRKGSEKPL